MLAALALTLAHAAHQPPTVPVVESWSFDPEEAILTGYARCRDCRVRTQRYRVEYEWHSGFSLHPEGRPDEQVYIVFARPSILRQFVAYFPGREVLGDQGYCQCRGVRYELPGGNAILRVTAATLFGR